MSDMWSEGYDRNETVWYTEDDRQILIKDLDDRHLVNILNWMLKSNHKMYPEDFKEFMAAEADLRRMQRFAEGKPYPKRNEDGKFVLIQ